VKPRNLLIRARAIRFWLAAAFGLLIATPHLGFSWGHEGHAIVALIAEHYMTPAALKSASDLLDGANIDSVASWADEYRRDHPETGPWHYIDIPLADSRIDMTRECLNGDCVIGKTEQFLAVLKDAKADHAAKAEALRYVVHFVGDLHQPLHDEDNGDKGGNGRRVTFDGKPDNLHWAWDTGLIEHINRNPEALAAELESKITAQDRAEWDKGSLGDWVLEGHRLAQTVAYGDLPAGDPAPISAAYEGQADPVIKTQLEKAGVRLAYLLNQALQ
jgi:S1/P1 Nuclease